MKMKSTHLRYEEDAGAYRTEPTLFVNGKRLPSSLSSRARPNQTLLDFLRVECKLTGSKLGCGEGGCGACTVLVSRLSGKGRVVHVAVNACLFPVLAADGCHVTTIEGIGSFKHDGSTLQSNCDRNGEAKEDYLHPIQRAMIDFHGSQCGYCTPGIIMALYGLFADNEPNAKHLEEHLDGNLCRCTGYRPIWDAARSLCGDVEETVGPCGTPCRQCPEREDCTMDCNVKDKAVCSSTASKVNAYQTVLREKHSDDWWKQPTAMFPTELLDEGLQNQLTKPLKVCDDSIHNGGTWYQPTSLLDLLSLIETHNEAGVKLVVGNTEVGIETKFKHAIYSTMIHPSRSIPGLYDVSTPDDFLVIGSCASLSSLQSTCHQLMSDESEARKAKTARPIHDMLRWFASTQIRNVACIGGNLVTASPISDMNPMLASMRGVLTLAKHDRGEVARRQINVSDFFTGYRSVAMHTNEIIECVSVPLLRDRFEYVSPFKQARRREDDISIVTAGMRLSVTVSCGNKWSIDSISLAFGGVAPTTILAQETMAYLTGREFSEASFDGARRVLQDELRMPDDVPGGQPQYRLTLASSFLYKFFLYCAGELVKDVGDSPGKYPPLPVVEDEASSGAAGFISAAKPSITGTQTYPEPMVAAGLESEKYGDVIRSKPMAAVAAKGQSKEDLVGKPATHASGPLHCTGEALYADDIPSSDSLLHGSLILATQCHSTLESIDVSPALQIPGVAGAFTHEDIIKLGGDNRMGPILLDDVAFLQVGEQVGFVGQVLGIVVADSQEIAEKGARAVSTTYSELDGNAIVSIEDAILANSFWTDFRHTIQRGDVDDALKQSEVDGKKLVVVEGSFRSGGQEHFYLEPNSTLAVPSESATNLTIYASTQAPTKTQDFVARVTNTPAARVVVRMKRMGGGFGGKETRSVFSSVACAVAAKLTNRPCRLTMNRDTDMATTGGRHAFLAKYKAGALVADDGSVKLHAFSVQLFNNGGCKFDLTGPVLDRALFHVDNCYMWPNFRAVGTPCRTSQPPHTAFRGFGGPQGMAVTEHVMDHLAQACNVSGDQLRRTNMYTLQDCTPFGMRFGGKFTGKWNVPSMFDCLYSDLDIPGRRAAASEFNKKNKWSKRGIAFTPTKFGIAFTAKFMNQGGALVHLYTDGTVLVSHGGTEMGQGLHTKVCQVAAQAFGIPLDDVYVNDSSTDKVANTIPSAASMSTDLYGMATLDACQKILKRIKPIRDSLPADAPLKDVAKKAFFDRIDLTAHGFFAVDDDRCGFDWAMEKPEDFDDTQPENSWKGHPFNYFTQGVAFAEVEIDVLTGNHKTIRADVLVDVGSSINPAIDIGQIEGAYIQGVGWCTTEEVVYADSDHTWIRPRARVFTTGPGTYKIPAFNDVPETFNVSLLEDASNPFAVHSSKAVGEPPFFLGTSVFYAIKDAVKAARTSDDYFEFRMPATSERIRMACGDYISEECIAAGKASSFQPKGSY